MVDTDYLGMLSESFADGLDLEIITFAALKNAWKNATLKSEREHVTQYIIHHPEKFNLQDFVSPIGYFGDNRWTLDEEEDFIFIKTVLEYFLGNNKDYGYMDIIHYLKENPNVSQINSMYRRNEGLENSLANDAVTSGGKE